jgi:hypothetical protein
LPSLSEEVASSVAMTKSIHRRNWFNEVRVF